MEDDFWKEVQNLSLEKGIDLDTPLADSKPVQILIDNYRRTLKTRLEKSHDRKHAYLNYRNELSQKYKQDEEREKMYLSFSGGEKTTIRESLVDFYRRHQYDHYIEFAILDNLLLPRIEKIFEIYSIAMFLPELDYQAKSENENLKGKLKQESDSSLVSKIRWNGNLEQLAKLIYILNENGWIEDIYDRKVSLHSKASALLNCFEPVPVNNKASSPDMRLRSLAANLKASKIKQNLDKNIEFDGILKKSEGTNSRRSLKSK